DREDQRQPPARYSFCASGRAALAGDERGQRVANPCFASGHDQRVARRPKASEHFLNAFAFATQPQDYSIGSNLPMAEQPALLNSWRSAPIPIQRSASVDGLE